MLFRSLYVYGVPGNALLDGLAQGLAAELNKQGATMARVFQLNAQNQIDLAAGNQRINEGIVQGVDAIVTFPLDANAIRPASVIRQTRYLTPDRTCDSIHTELSYLTLSEGDIDLIVCATLRTTLAELPRESRFTVIKLRHLGNHSGQIHPNQLPDLLA